MKLDLAAFQRALWRALLFVGSASAHLQAASTLDAFFENNGSFELGAVDGPFTLASDYGTQAITGWTIYASGSGLKLLEDAGAYDGNRYLNLTSTGGESGSTYLAQMDNVWEFQNFFWVDWRGVTLIFEMDADYELSFWAAGGVGISNSMYFDLYGANQVSSVTVPGYTQAEFDAMSGLLWERYVIPFHTIGAEIPLENRGPWDMTLYMGLGGSTVVGENSSLYIDNFAITRVPEPSGLFLACAAAGLSLRQRRRKPMHRRPHA
jgi:hypothetical protein